MSFPRLLLCFSLLNFGFLSQGFAQEKAPAAESAKSDASKSAEKTSADSKSRSAKSESDAKKKTASTNEKTQEKATPPKIKVQLLKLSGIYVDFNEPMGIDPTMLFMDAMPAKQKSFYKLCEFLKDLGENEAIPYVVLDLSDPIFMMNPAQLDEMNRRLKTLKSHNKKVYAWLESAGSEHLSLAAACDEVIMADFGGVDFPSMAMETAFYREAMDLIGIKASIVRAGDFKGAVEPFMNAQMSDHLRQHYLEMLESMNDARVSAIAKGRGLPVANVRDIQKKRFLLPKEALSKDLVDQLAPFGSMKETIAKSIGKEIDWVEPSKKAPKEMSFFEVMSVVMSGPKSSTNRLKEPSIVVLHLSGVIQDGKQASPGSLVAGPIVDQIEKLIDDSRVHGVVIRINSPGGSATASEAIRQALKKLADKKPTVVSMGEVAASGGYWISCIEAPVYAEPSTLTGSIGVFSLKLSFGSLLRRIGVHMETIALDPSASAFSVGRPWSDEDVSVLQETVDDVYQRFLKLVADSRKLPVEKIQRLAGGRVWSGAQAKEHHLVDELGGVDDCLAVVAKKAKLDKYSIVHRPEPSSGFELFELLGEQGDDELLLKIFASDAWKTLRSSGFQLETLRAILKQSLQPSSAPHIWTILPAELKIR
jgi:protease IV